MTNEQIYDDQINPLMAQIIAICAENGIPFACQFELDAEKDLMCTSAMTFKSRQIKAVYRTMCPQAVGLAVTIMDGTPIKAENMEEIV